MLSSEIVLAGAIMVWKEYVLLESLTIKFDILSEASFSPYRTRALHSVSVSSGNLSTSLKVENTQLAAIYRFSESA